MSGSGNYRAGVCFCHRVNCLTPTLTMKLQLCHKRSRKLLRVYYLMSRVNRDCCKTMEIKQNCHSFDCTKQSAIPFIVRHIARWKSCQNMRKALRPLKKLGQIYRKDKSLIRATYMLISHILAGKFKDSQ